jgi:predicted RNA binding protein YcfA (HicA-like mRNA interferase family)
MVYNLKMTMGGKECIKLLKKHGWIVDRIQGSHHIMFNGNADLKPGTLNAILKKAGLK